MKTAGIEVRMARKEDAGRISDFVKSFWGSEYPPAHWDWKYFSNPFGPSGLAIALDGERVVGRAGSCALPFVVHGAPITTHFLCDTDVFAEYRSQAVTLKLVSVLSGTPGPQGYQGLEFALALPTAADFVQVFLGFQALGRSDSFVKVINPLAFLSRKLRTPLPAFMHRVVRAARVATLSRGGMVELPGERADDAIDGAGCSPVAVGIPKDRRYLEWRYLRCPGSRPSLYLDGAPHGKGLAILDYASIRGVRYGIIQDIVCREIGGDTWRNLLASAVFRLARGGADAVVMRGIFPRPVVACLHGQHFVRRKSEYTLVARANTEKKIADAIGDRSTWWLPMGDSGLTA